jgi:hypothetical protein
LNHEFTQSMHWHRFNVYVHNPHQFTLYIGKKIINLLANNKIYGDERQSKTRRRPRSPEQNEAVAGISQYFEGIFGKFISKLVGGDGDGSSSGSQSLCHRSNISLFRKQLKDSFCWQNPRFKITASHRI